MYLINANSGKEIFPDRKSLNNKPIITRGSNKKEWNGKDYDSTGNISVDMVMQAIDFYRIRAMQGGKPLKRIILSNAHYDRLDDYMRLTYLSKEKEYEELCDENNENRKWTVDGVPIDRAGWMYVKHMDFEFYPTFADALNEARNTDIKENTFTDLASGKLNDLPKTTDTFNVIRDKK